MRAVFVPHRGDPAGYWGPHGPPVALYLLESDDRVVTQGDEGLGSYVVAPYYHEGVSLPEKMAFVVLTGDMYNAVKEALTEEESKVGTSERAAMHKAIVDRDRQIAQLTNTIENLSAAIAIEPKEVTQCQPTQESLPMTSSVISKTPER